MNVSFGHGKSSDFVSWRLSEREHDKSLSFFSQADSTMISMIQWDF